VNLLSSPTGGNVPFLELLVISMVCLILWAIHRASTRRGP